jgi:hypothetical protein
MEADGGLVQGRGWHRQPAWGWSVVGSEAETNTRVESATALSRMMELSQGGPTWGGLGGQLVRWWPTASSLTSAVAKSNL